MAVTATEPAAARAWALLQAYEQARAHWPAVPALHHRPQSLGSLVDLLPQADAVLLDAFGVLNLGAQAIPGAAQALQRLRELKVPFRIVSNAASVPKATLVQRYRHMGLPLRAEDFVTSRDVVAAALAAAPQRRWAVVAPAGADWSDLPLAQARRCEAGALQDGDEAVLFLCAQGWDDTAQQRLEHDLRRRPRPVWVANPDLISPWEGGWAREPGGWCLHLAARTGAAVQMFGKPFAAIFERALASLPPGVRRTQVWMLGDTLHTDVLGALAAGLRAALVTGAGASTGLDVQQAAATTGIVPHAVLPFIGPGP